MDELRNKYSINFSYNDKKLPLKKSIIFDRTVLSLREILKKLSEDAQIEFYIHNDIIILRPKIPKNMYIINGYIEDNTNGEKVIYSKWVHRSIGVVIKGDLDEVERYFAIRESGWTEDMQELILTGKVEIGMTTHMVFYAWGRPDRVKQTKESEENAEMWVYEKRSSKIQYLLFRAGILIEVKHSQN